jgi:hypothetical protein
VASLVNFPAKLYILWPFGLFSPFWYIFTRFGMLYQARKIWQPCGQAVKRFHAVDRSANWRGFASADKLITELQKKVPLKVFLFLYEVWIGFPSQYM